MSCSNCLHWIQKRFRVYDDGSKVLFFWVKEPNGLCEKLSTETEPDFHCSKHALAPNFDHNEIIKIEGTPWQNFKMGNCPDCDGRGSGVHGGICGRCVGTGKVRFYDDGFVGEEKTRMHPREMEIEKAKELEKRRVAAQAILDGMPPPQEPPDGTKLAPIEKPSIL